jgi:enoyl-CoA hydratase/carnithine racemase
MHQDVIIYNNRRWNAADLLEKGVVIETPVASELMTRAMDFTAGLKAKGQGPARSAMQPIKQLVYQQVLKQLENKQGMGYGGRQKGVDRAAPPRRSRL